MQLAVAIACSIETMQFAVAIACSSGRVQFEVAIACSIQQMRFAVATIATQAPFGAAGSALMFCVTAGYGQLVHIEFKDRNLYTCTDPNAAGSKLTLRSK